MTSVLQEISHNIPWHVNNNMLF